MQNPEKMDKQYREATLFRPIQESVKPINEKYPNSSVYITADSHIELNNLPEVKEFGAWRLITFNDKQTLDEHLVLIKGDVTQDIPLLVRVHSSFVLNEIFYIEASDDRAQLQEGMRIINRNGRGMIIYLQQEGAGNRLATVVAQLALTNEGIPMTDAFQQLGVSVENRSFQLAADILTMLEIKIPIALMTNNVNKRKQLQEAGFTVVPYEFNVHVDNPTVNAYLESKKGAGIYNSSPPPDAIDT